MQFPASVNRWVAGSNPARGANYGKGSSPIFHSKVSSAGTAQKWRSLPNTSGKFRPRTSEYTMSDPEPTRLRTAGNAFELAIRAMGQALVDASAAAHEIDALDPPKDD